MINVYLDNLAIQNYALLGAGLSRAAICLLHIDTGYFYKGGEIDLQGALCDRGPVGSICEPMRQGAGAACVEEGGITRITTAGH